MSCDAEPSRRPGQHRTGAIAQLIHPAALAAMKMMVVRFPRNFVAGGLAGQRDGFQPTFRQQGLDIAVYGCDAQLFVVTFRRAQCLFRREWAICFDEGLADGLLLSCIARDGLRHTP